MSATRTSGRALRRGLTVAGGVIVVGIVAAGAFQLIALAVRHKFDVRTSYAGIHSLDVEAGSGDVHLSAAPAGSPLVVVAHATEGFAKPHLHAVQAVPGVLRISYVCKVDVDCGASYSVSVPAGVAVTAHAGDGNLDADQLSTTEPLKLTSGDGDVHAAGIGAPTVTLQSGDGDVNATLIRAPAQLTAHSGDGDVRLTVPDTTYAVRASSGDGTVSDQTVKIDPSSPRKIVATSDDGDVRITAQH